MDINNIQENAKDKIDIKWILIVVLTIGIIYMFFNFNNVPRDREYERILSNRVDSLLGCIDVLQAASTLDKDTIRINNETIKYLYINKTKDSTTIAQMPTSDNVIYFKEYIDTYNPVELKGDTVIIDGSYIQGANSLFLDRDVKIEQVGLLEDNIVHMKSIESRYIKQIETLDELCTNRLKINQYDMDRLEDKVRKQRKDLLMYKIGSVTSLAILVALII